MNHIKLTHDCLDVGVLSDLASSSCCGAISVFVGTTRDNFGGKKVLNLEYEAYERMAVKQLEFICKDLRHQWADIVNIVIYHRLGSVGIREASVVIAISSPHRKTSLSAVSVAIDEVKKRVPIWKKEIYDGYHASWKENKECPWLNEKTGSECTKKPQLNKVSVPLVEDSPPLSSQLVQISASEKEIKRRIQCFVERKRKEIDECNIMDFTDTKQKCKENLHQSDITQEAEEINGNASMTCARVNSFVVKQQYSKCHLKVKRVKNDIGPQTQTDYLDTLDKLMVPTDVHSKGQISHYKDGFTLKYPLIMKRLTDIEEHFNIPQSKVKNIYQRLKNIEDRILFLESVSPEYRNFLADTTQAKSSTGECDSVAILRNEKTQYSLNEIDKIVQRFEEHCLDNLKKKHNRLI